MKYFTLGVIFAAFAAVADGQQCTRYSQSPPNSNPPYTYVAGSGGNFDVLLCNDAHLANINLSNVKGEKLVKATLKVSLHDADPGESHEMKMNGKSVGTIKNGCNNQWTLTTLDVTNKINLGQTHRLVIDIDDSAHMCAQINWISIELKFVNQAVKGDPHFRTWAGESYDFHGVCDLVLLSNPEFGNQIGLDIHIRTKKTRAWSFVSSAAVRIGKDTLEVSGGSDEPNFWINGEKRLELPTSISGYSMKFSKGGVKSGSYIIELDDEAVIQIKTWNAYVSVDIGTGTSMEFAGSTGLMGTFPDGIRLARDNASVMENDNAFGQEWQVLPSEEDLFHSTEGPQSPEKCEIPTVAQQRRRLGESIITKEDAQVACARVSQEDFDLCVFDVMATNDKNAVGAY